MSKAVIYRYFTIFMAVVVLFTSTGIGLVESHCMLRGKSLQLVSKEKKMQGCKLCKPASGREAAKASVVVKKADCCKETQQYKHVEFLSSFSKLLLKMSKSFSDSLGGLPDDFRFALFGTFASVPARAFKAVSFSSLLYGRSMLSFVQSFLI